MLTTSDRQATVVAVSMPDERRASRRERLSGEVVTGADGTETEPSRACPFEAATPIPSMLVPRELNYLRWLAGDLRGSGRVVELGCFLGGSTAALLNGMRANDRVRTPLLTYDAFTLPDDQSADMLAWLDSCGVRPGESFRATFDRMCDAHKAEIIVREMWLPEMIASDNEAHIYPEQAEIELLFVDAAKTWGVHTTIMRTFSRHLHEGATLVQQDFMDLQWPWIPLHMWQLRGAFEPLDVLHGTPTVSFRQVADPARELSNLWTPEDLETREHRCEAWARVIDYWSSLIGADAATALHGHAAFHAMMAGDAEDAVRHGRIFEGWSRSAESDGVYFAPAWPGIAASMGDTLANDAGARVAHLFAAETAARGSRLARKRPGECTAFYPGEIRRAVWGDVLDRLRKAGHHRIALFGAGRHTRWLLNEQVIPDDMTVTCILDDAPGVDEIGSTPVTATEGLVSIPGHPEVVLPSSDGLEPQMLLRLHELFGSMPGLEIQRVYTRSDAADPTQGGWRYTLECAEGTASTHRCGVPTGIPAMLPERERLGLDKVRPWVDTFNERYCPPEWATGFTSPFDAAFLWDMIEAVHPREMIEIGTASGVSTAMIAAGLQHICGDEARLSTFDLAACCYFDPDRPMAAAMMNMAPELIDHVRMYARTNANDAATCFPRGGIDLAFIDGNHAHPAPVLDLLALLYSLRSEAWVVLHDIELSRLTFDSSVPTGDWQNITGAEKLFEAWPFEKIQPSGRCREERNVGAIRMPAVPSDALPCLLSLLDEPWEIHESMDPSLMILLDRLRESGLT